MHHAASASQPLRIEGPAGMLEARLDLPGGAQVQPTAFAGAVAQRR